MKASMALRAQAGSFTAGSGGRTGGRNDQCFCHFAPCSIQRRKSSICAAVSFLPALDRRHALVVIVGGQPLKQLALRRIAGNERLSPIAQVGESARLGIEPQLGLALALVGAVALVAVIRRIGRMSR